MSGELQVFQNQLRSWLNHLSVRYGKSQSAHAPKHMTYLIDLTSSQSHYFILRQRRTAHGLLPESFHHQHVLHSSTKS